MTSEQIYNLINNNPGITAKEIAEQMCGEKRSSRFWAKLPTLEANGYLVYIDNDSRLYPYRNLNTNPYN